MPRQVGIISRIPSPTNGDVEEIYEYEKRRNQWEKIFSHKRIYGLAFVGIYFSPER